MGSMPLPRPTEAVALAMPVDELGRPSRPGGACFPRLAGQAAAGREDTSRRGSRTRCAGDR